MENHNFLWVNQHKSTISMAVASIADCNKFPEGNGKIQKNGWFGGTPGYPHDFGQLQMGASQEEAKTRSKR